MKNNNFYLSVLWKKTWIWKDERTWFNIYLDEGANSMDPTFIKKSLLLQNKRYVGTKLFFYKLKKKNTKSISFKDIHKSGATKHSNSNLLPFFWHTSLYEVLFWIQMFGREFVFTIDVNLHLSQQDINQILQIRDRFTQTFFRRSISPTFYAFYALRS